MPFSRIAGIGSVMLATLIALGCTRRAGAKDDGASLAAEATTDLFRDRAMHPTVLAVHGPSPQAFSPWPDGGRVQVVEYPSKERMLRGLVARPLATPLARGGKSPALVYLHGGFALGEEDVEDCAPFLNAGFVVWAPAYRGENGNPGDHELYFGELDDARAAVDFARTLADVDPARIVVFGHSAGGVLSSLLSLYPDLPAGNTGSAGGIYGPEVFNYLKGRPFVDSPQERRMRLFVPYAEQMKKPHFACVGEDYTLALHTTTNTAARLAARHLPFEARVVAGDHSSSLPACLAAFLDRVLPQVR